MLPRPHSWISHFGLGEAHGAPADAAALGSKGAGLATMSTLGLPVPPGFTIATSVCATYYAESRTLPEGLEADVQAGLEVLERGSGLRFGSPHDPLFVSVRSGAPSSMPGMMDTVLNVGLNDVTVVALGHRAGDERFAWDSYRRFVQAYADVVLGLDTEPFDAALAAARRQGTPDWRALTATFLRLAADGSGTPFPQDAHAQLWGAVRAVLDSWCSRRATNYRRLHNLPDVPGTAVTVQSMVFGNAGAESATGVGFTRDPAIGAPEPFGEFAANAQGDDVVSGTLTPQPLSRAGRERLGGASTSLEEAMPAVYADLVAHFRTLERHFGAMQDVEFTIERGRLWLLQTRAGSTSPHASARIAVDMANEGLIDRRRALAAVDVTSVGRLMHPSVRADSGQPPLAKGLPASPGAAAGAVAFTAEDADMFASQGRAAILVLTETHPRDICGIHAAAGILTSRGGATSHAAIVARGMGRPCVVGAGEVRVDAAAGTFVARGREVRRGEIITIDGGTGEVFLGALPLERPELGPAFATLLGWSDAVRRLGVRANTETPDDVTLASALGAQGIGLLRTEFSFQEPEALALMRALILADSGEARRTTLDGLLTLQRAAYARVLAFARGMPITIRLLDLPLSAFVPQGEDEIAAVAAHSRTTLAEARARIAALAETNPALGHRGCRLAVSWPDLYAVQVRAILEAAVEIDASIVPQILVPMVSLASEFAHVAANIAGVAAAIAGARRAGPRYQVGAMIEVPRAALRAGELARTASFLSFGTNNLTQTTFGVARDDAAAFLERYRERGIVPGDPFVTLDTGGVGELLREAVARGRAVRPDLEIGVCGEHGGDPASIDFFHRIGVDYVSVSPFRLPTARLAAAKAALAS